MFKKLETTSTSVTDNWILKVEYFTEDSYPTPIIKIVVPDNDSAVPFMTWDACRTENDIEAAEVFLKTYNDAMEEFKSLTKTYSGKEN